jgi:hypothetical protein
MQIAVSTAQLDAHCERLTNFLIIHIVVEETLIGKVPQRDSGGTKILLSLGVYVQRPRSGVRKEDAPRVVLYQRWSLINPPPTGFRYFVGGRDGNCHRDPSYAYAGDPSNDLLAGHFLHVSNRCPYSSAFSQTFFTKVPFYN